MRPRRRPPVVPDAFSPAVAPMGVAEKRVRQLAIEVGHRSLGALAKAVGVNRRTVLLAARGDSSPSPAMVERIARTLRVDPALLASILETARAEKAAS
jgi:predicted transcriptional regulator